MFGRDVYTCLVVAIQSVQRSTEITDKVNDESVQGVIRSLISKRVGPTLSTGQTVKGRAVARFGKKTDVGASAIEDVQYLNGRLLEGSAVMDRRPRLGIWRIHERRDGLRGRTGRE